MTAPSLRSRVMSALVLLVLVAVAANVAWVLLASLLQPALVLIAVLGVYGFVLRR